MVNKWDHGWPEWWANLITSLISVVFMILKLLRINNTLLSDEENSLQVIEHIVYQSATDLCEINIFCCQTHGNFDTYFVKFVRNVWKI